MSKVVAIEHLTLDSVMQGPARPEEDTRDGFEYGGWAAARNDPAMMEALGAHGQLVVPVGRSHHL